MQIRKNLFLCGILATGIIAGGAFISGRLFAAAWNSPGVTPVQNSIGQWIDANTGQFISTKGMHGAGPTGTGNTNPGTGTTPTGTTGTTPANTQNGATQGTKNSAKPAAKGWKGMSGTQRAMGAAGAVAGAAGIYASTTGDGEHGVMNVVGGVASGALGGSAFGIWGIVGGALIGGAITGSQLFSETDCLHDPITGQFTCCNTLFNQGERQVPIGGYMFCGDKNNQPMALGVRQCLQGGKSTASGWWDGLWEDDEWSRECTVRLCPGQVEIANGTPTESIVPIPDQEQICWKWECADGYTKKGNTCVSNTGASSGGNGGDTDTNAYDILIRRIQQQIQQLQQECGGVL